MTISTCYNMFQANIHQNGPEILGLTTYSMRIDSIQMRRIWQGCLVLSLLSVATILSISLVTKVGCAMRVL
jgi:hypothetical protein